MKRFLNTAIVVSFFGLVAATIWVVWDKREVVFNTFNSLLYISGGEDIDENEIIERLSMDIADLELAQQPLITVLNKVRAGR